MISLTRTGSLWFDAEIAPAALPTHLSYHLRSVHASTVKVHGNCVAFTRRMFRSSAGRTNILIPFEFGDLTVDAKTHQISYRVSVRQLLFYGTGVIGVIALFGLGSPDRQKLLWIMPLLWFGLVGGSYVIGIVRFKRFIGRTLASAPHLTQQSLSTQR